MRREQQHQLFKIKVSTLPPCQVEQLILNN